MIPASAFNKQSNETGKKGVEPSGSASATITATAATAAIASPEVAKKERLAVYTFLTSVEDRKPLEKETQITLSPIDRSILLKRAGETIAAIMGDSPDAMSKAVPELEKSWELANKPNIYNVIYVLVECYTHGWGVQADFNKAVNLYKLIEGELLLPKTLKFLISCVNSSKKPDANLAGCFAPNLYSLEKCTGIGYLLMVKTIEVIRQFQGLDVYKNKESNQRIYLLQLDALEHFYDKFFIVAPDHILYDCVGFLMESHQALYSQVIADDDFSNTRLLAMEKIQSLRNTKALIKKRIIENIPRATIASPAASVSSAAKSRATSSSIIRANTSPSTIQSPSAKTAAKIPLNQRQVLDVFYIQLAEIIPHNTGLKFLLLCNTQLIIKKIKDGEIELAKKLFSELEENCIKNPDDVNKITLEFIAHCYTEGIVVEKDFSKADELIGKLLLGAQLGTQMDPIAGTTNVRLKSHPPATQVKSLKAAPASPKASAKAASNHKLATLAAQYAENETPLKELDRLASNPSARKGTVDLMLLDGILDGVRTTKPEDSYELYFDLWDIREHIPEKYKSWDMITLKGEILRYLQSLLQDDATLKVIRKRGRLPKNLIAHLCEQSVEQCKLNEKEVADTNNQLLNNLYQQFQAFPRVLLEDAKPLGVLQRDVHTILAQVQHIIAINVNLIKNGKGNYADVRTTKRQKGNNERDLDRIQKDIRDLKYDQKFDSLALQHKELIEALNKIHAERASEIAKAFKAKELEAVQKIAREFDDLLAKGRALISAMRNIKDELARLKKTLKDQQSLFSNAEAEIKLYQEDPKTRAAREASEKFIAKQIEAFKAYEKAHKEKLANLEAAQKQKSEALAKLEALRKREEELKQVREKRQAKHAEFLADQPKKTSLEGSEETHTPVSIVGSATATVSSAARAQPLTLNTKGAISIKVSDTMVQRDINKQITEGGALVAELMTEYSIENTLYSLLGMLGKILESMHNPMILEGDPRLATIATAVRNTVFHGGPDIIPNFEKKLSSEAEALKFIEDLQAITLELLSNDWQDPNTIETQVLPALFVKLALYRAPVNPTPATAGSAASTLTAGASASTASAASNPTLATTGNATTKGMTVAELEKQLNRSIPDTIKHTKEECEQQLTFYSQKLQGLKKTKTHNRLVKKHAMGYLKARISVYAMQLKAIDPESFANWCTKLNTLDIKIGALYRHNLQETHTKKPRSSLSDNAAANAAITVTAQPPLPMLLSQPFANKQNAATAAAPAKVEPVSNSM